MTTDSVHGPPKQGAPAAARRPQEDDHLAAGGSSRGRGRDGSRSKLLLVSLTALFYLVIGHENLMHLSLLGDELVETRAIASSAVSCQTTVVSRPRTSSGTPVFLNDRSIRLSPYVKRPWLDQDGSELPPAKILLTNYGWNHPNQTIGVNHTRSIRQRELLQGIVDHPWADPFAWHDYETGATPIDPSIRYYVFLDIETCFEANYPSYVGRVIDNSDTSGYRSVTNKGQAACISVEQCSFVSEVMESKLFTTPGVHATLILIDCRGNGLTRQFRHKKYNTTAISLAAISTTADRLNLQVDQGLPPPAVKPLSLTNRQIQDILDCNEDSRPFLLTYSGADRGIPARLYLATMGNGRDILTFSKGSFRDYNKTYEQILLESKFSAAPRGTNLFSYRFTEVLSAGSIPVVHADGWVWPFRPELVDWSECAVIIPEEKVNETEAILRSISPERRCSMRKRCFDIYRKYMANAEGTIAGLVEGLELVAKAKQGTEH